MQENAVSHSALKVSASGNQRWSGALHNGNKVVVDTNKKSLRSGPRLFYSGKIDKKQLTSKQAKYWAQKLDRGADYTCLDKKMKQVVEQQN